MLSQLFLLGGFPLEQAVALRISTALCEGAAPWGSTTALENCKRHPKMH